MEIKVLGPGCANCNKLEKIVSEAVKELGMSDPVIKVSNIQEMLSFGVMCLLRLRLLTARSNSPGGCHPKRKSKSICRVNPGKRL